MAEDNRRKQGRRDEESKGEGGERRIIQRFSDSRITQHYKHIMIWTRIMLGLTIGMGIFFLGIALVKGGSQLGLSLFDSVVFFFISGFLFKYQQSIKLFLTNDSVNNLEASVEKQLNLWILFGVFSIIFVVVGLVFS